MSTHSETCAMCDGTGRYEGLVALLERAGVEDDGSYYFDTTCRCCGGSGEVEKESE